MNKLNFKCKCGKDIAVTLNPGETKSATCSCSLAYLATMTESGTFIVRRDTVVDSPKGNAGRVEFPSGGISGKRRWTTVSKGKIGDVAKLPQSPSLNDQMEYVISVDENCITSVTMAPFSNQPNHFKLSILKMELEVAVKFEDYEQAAKLRDRIKELGYE